ncbi:hypothetical protein KGF36_19880, partial [Clostridioides sp. ZZV14-6009]|nr:hypothetical protein [Clostridioides sp. ZZV14-6009]
LKTLFIIKIKSGESIPQFKVHSTFIWPQAHIKNTSDMAFYPLAFYAFYCKNITTLFSKVF